MEIIRLENDEKIVAKGQKSGGIVVGEIVIQGISLLVWFLILQPLFMQDIDSKLAIRYESLSDLFSSWITRDVGLPFAVSVFFTLSIILVLGAAVRVIFAVIRHTRRSLVLTDRRIFGHTGNLLLGLKELDLPLTQITRISASESGLDRIFGFGRIRIETPLGNYRFTGFINPFLFCEYAGKQKWIANGGVLSELSGTAKKRNLLDSADWKPKQDDSYLDGDTTCRYAKTVQEVAVEYEPTLAGKWNHNDIILKPNERLLLYIGAALVILGGASAIISGILLAVKLFSGSDIFFAMGKIVLIPKWIITTGMITMFITGGFVVFMGICLLKYKKWAFRTVQILHALGLVANCVAFIGQLPELNALLLLIPIAFGIFMIWYAGTCADLLSRMVQYPRHQINPY